ncbi:hypothetical protein PLICRDRAFT_167674 [Plicaturopsis crispa FD-325 SS-3]|uniref:Glutamate decarboxylase n=1 Tax=Plicaturopsis crispa FD-325 SS-3 TaxID=944288 RepID=A0A0C9SL10_PLICR|nr:hypothetical protein PLICRDRAFT_167674 [Plicaturopsis crispa FD-325 SS-3]
MPLSRHIDADAIIAAAKEHPHREDTADHAGLLHSSWDRDEDAVTLPKYTLPKSGIPSRSAYQLIHDEITLDGNPTLNLATYLHTWMPGYAEKLIMENIGKNAVEWPATQVIHNRCISILADLWKVPNKSKVIGTATLGSSEGVMLGGLAMKKRWQEAQKKAGKDHYHPNIVFGANAHNALEKFARYWDVEARIVPVKAETDFIMHPPDAMKFIDENTIGVICISGSTYTGHLEDVQLMSDLLDKLQAKTGLDIPIHIDAASGGFVAPFAYSEQYKWSFEIPRVHSINTSGHKFGLVYPGVGWVLWRDESLFHKDLIFEYHYLGGVEYSYTLNFSKPAAPIIAQYFNMLNLGFEGYRQVAIKDLRNARLLSRALDETYFKVVSNIHKPSASASLSDETKGGAQKAHGNRELGDDPELYQRGLPVVTFRLSDEYQAEYPHVQQGWISSTLRAKGWIIPNYRAPQGEEQTELLRVVVRETLSEDLVERLIVDILETTKSLMIPGASPFMPDSAPKFDAHSSSGSQRLSAGADVSGLPAPAGEAGGDSGI